MKKLSVIMALILCAGSLRAQTTKPASRSADQIEADLNGVGDKLAVAMDHGAAADSAESRTKAAPAVLPDLQRMIGLFEELRAANPDMTSEIDPQIVQLRTLQLVFGDAGVQKANAQAAIGGDALAKGERAVADYMSADDDAARLKALDAFGAAMKSDSANDSMVDLLSFVAATGVRGHTPAEPINARLLDIAQNDAKGPMAAQIADALNAHIKLRAMLNKPVVLSEVQMDGKPFSTADWKGKVILVDFWATWCPGCVAEMPVIEKLYQEYHAQGLEVLGVSSDNSLDDLKKFLAENPGMAWPQLFNAKAPGMNPLASTYGFQLIGIPAQFVIDRNGILRNIQAAETPGSTALDIGEMDRQMHKLMPELLSEKGK